MKRIITILLCVFLALCLAACGASNTSAAGSRADSVYADPNSSEAKPAARDYLAEETPTETAASESPPRPLGQLDPERARLNSFLTRIVQQDIVNTSTELDEDAELVRFVFGYRKTNDPDSIVEKKYRGVFCRTLTLEQVNETLNKLFGKTISPDQKEYSIPIGESESFQCLYRKGRFWNIPPYPAEQYSFPLRFALVSRVDEENCSLHFRLYQINPWIWGEDEAERHVGVMPHSNFLEVESTDNVKYLGEGDAVLRDFGEELQLVEMAAAITY